MNGMAQLHRIPLAPGGCFCFSTRARHVCRSSGDERRGSLDKSKSVRPYPDPDSGIEKQDPLQPQQDQQQTPWGSTWTKRGFGGSRSAGSHGSYFAQKPSDPGAARHFSSGNSSSGSHTTGGSQSAADPPALDPHLQASIHKNVDQAAEVLQDIVNEVLNEVLLEEASAFVLGQERCGEQLPLAQVG